MSENLDISTLGLTDLKKYACPKVNFKREWYLDCVGCQGVKGCTA